MSEPREDGCYCQKCGAPVDPTDEKCPNGHVFAEVGRAYVRSASASIKITADAVLVHRAQSLTDDTKKYVADKLQKIIAEEMEEQEE